MVNPFVTYPIFKSTLYSYTSVTIITTGKTAVVKTERIDYGKINKKDSWCKKNPYDVIPVVYPSTYTVTVGSTFV